MSAATPALAPIVATSSSGPHLSPRHINESNCRMSAATPALEPIVIVVLYYVRYVLYAVVGRGGGRRRRRRRQRQARGGGNVPCGAGTFLAGRQRQARGARVEGEGRVEVGRLRRDVSECVVIQQKDRAAQTRHCSQRRRRVGASAACLEMSECVLSYRKKDRAASSRDGTR